MSCKTKSIMDILQLVAIASLVLLTCFLFFKPRTASKLPPGPYPFPIIGNLLLLGQSPHHTVTDLSKSYGPLMSLHLGSIYTVVVSSAEVAKIFLTKHDLAVSSRTIPTAARAFDHHKHTIAFSPVGTEWRRFRKLGKEHLFSAASLEASQELRQEKVQRLREYVQKCCDARRVVNVAEAAYVATLNLIGVTLFSMDLADFDSVDIQEFKSIFQALLGVLAEPNIADFFPILHWIDPHGIRKRSEFEFARLLGFLNNLINQRLKERSPDSPKKSDFLETLLDLAEGTEYNYTVKHIAHILIELIVAGTDSTVTMTEWAMTELLLNPEKLSKAKEELRTVIGEGNQIQETDFPRLPYFQAVIKEVLRYHTPAPFLIPRRSEQDVEINGYTIPKGTQLMVNAWAIGRDPDKWSNPDSFEPERFLDNKLDFKGQDFELIPYGAGRRICPGLQLADYMMQLMVATLIHNFDWKLESRLKPGEVENADKFGLSVRKAAPLRATPIKIA